jgi:hypothetical protein
MDMLTLLEKTDHLVGQFEEHLKLAIQITDDPKLKVFLGHLLDEEQEHRDKIASLKLAVLNSPMSPSTLTDSPPLRDNSPSQDGHFQRRDQQILTVGSLLGQAQ